MAAYGWRGGDAAGTARIVGSHGDYYKAVCEEAAGPVVARRKKSVFAGKDTKLRTVAVGRANVERRLAGDDAGVMRPVTGDFVAFRYNPHGESLVTGVLPRRSSFGRKDPAARRKSQTLAVNFDALFVTMSLTEDYSIPRMKRYLALAEDVGEAEVVALLTKRDLAGPDATAARLAEVAALGCRAIAVSTTTGEGMDAVRAMERPGATFAFVGSSGVGKSSVINALAGEEIAATGEIQAWSGRGRHTTTARELFMLPSGAMAIDTPGVREIGLLGEEDAVLAKGVSTHRWRL